MTTLVPGTAFRSRDPRLVVENRLDPGISVFTLTVVDDQGNESAPVQLSVTVLRQPPPLPTPPPSPAPPAAAAAGRRRPRVARSSTPKKPKPKPKPGAPR
jgi:hypothetical protein